MRKSFVAAQIQPDPAEREIGIDISGRRSKSVDEFISFEDPPVPDVGSDEERLFIFRRVRDEIREWMKDFITRRTS
jgi:hypothetical protein